MQQLLTGNLQPVDDRLQVSLRILDLVNGRALESVIFSVDNDLKAILEESTRQVPQLFGVVGSIQVWDQPERAEVFSMAPWWAAPRARTQNPPRG